jgi:hypothetical protein
VHARQAPLQERCRVAGVSVLSQARHYAGFNEANTAAAWLSLAVTPEGEPGRASVTAQMVPRLAVLVLVTKVFPFSAMPTEARQPLACAQALKTATMVNAVGIPATYPNEAFRPIPPFRK